MRLAVVDVFAAQHARFEGIQRLRQRFPRLTCIAYVAASHERSHDFFDAGRQGMNGLVIVDQDDSPRSLLALVEQAEIHSLGSIVAQLLENVDSTVRESTLLAIARAHERLSPERLANLLGLARRTMSQRLAAAGFPPPQRLLTWGKLIVAAHLLEEGQRSADRVAAALSFPSGSAFRNTCQRYVHATPREIAARGGAEYVIRAMLLVACRVREGEELLPRPLI